jgi:GAF domain-containing protein
VATTVPYPSLNIVYGPLPAAQANRPFNALLELSLAQTNSQGAYLYRLEREQDSLRLTTWSGQVPTEMNAFDVQLRPEAARWHRENFSAVLLDRAAWSDWRTERFPEFLRNRFEAAAGIPLIDSGEVVGLLHVCRLAPIAFSSREAAFLRSLGLPLGSLLTHSTARVKLENEVSELSRKLADRKLLDRAKGVLQARFQWTEEQAYLFLRRTSRQRRTPMREIAREVVAQ